MTRQEVNILKKFKPLYNSNKRYFLLTGGRGSLKTSTVMDFIARLSYEQGHVILYTRFTMKSASESIVPLFEKHLERMGILKDFTTTKTKITNIHTGSFIYFSGIKTNSGDQTGRLKSLPDVTTWIIEEGEDFTNEDTFDAIDDSIRMSDKQNRVIWIQNPTTREHFIYKKFIEPNSKKIDVHGYQVTVSNDPTVEHIHTTFHLAERLGYLAKSWLAKIQRTKDMSQKQIDNGKDKHETKYYYRYIGGWLERSEGAIYKNWVEGEYKETQYNGYGLDFGYNPDPLALIEISIDQKRKVIYMRECLYNIDLSDDDVINALTKVIPNKRKLIVSDTNEPRTRLSIKKAGFNILPAKKGAGSIADGIRSLQDYEFIVDPESNNLKAELNNYSWNNKKASIPIGEYNHLMDGLRYIFRYLTKKKGSRVRRVN